MTQEQVITKVDNAFGASTVDNMMLLTKKAKTIAKCASVTLLWKIISIYHILASSILTTGN
jgi:hypothetical protein